MVSTLNCCSCLGFSTKTEEFLSLPLPLPQGDTCTLDSCLRFFTGEEVLSDYYCASCKMNTSAKKSYNLTNAPDVLIIQLKRFSMPLRTKDMRLVNFPLEGLNISKLQNANCVDKFACIYDLFAVSEHCNGLGESGCGHYTAKCFNFINNVWYAFNDDVVSAIPKEFYGSCIVTSDAYVLFYRRRYFYAVMFFF